jgi:hypothetical protein
LHGARKPLPWSELEADSANPLPARRSLSDFSVYQKKALERAGRTNEPWSTYSRFEQVGGVGQEKTRHHGWHRTNKLGRYDPFDAQR